MIKKKPVKKENKPMSHTHTSAPMGVSQPHTCDWRHRGGTEAGKQWQMSRYGGTLASPTKGGPLHTLYKCTGCGGAVKVTRTL